MKIIKILFVFCLVINNITLKGQTLDDTTNLGGAWEWNVAKQTGPAMNQVAILHPNLKGTGVFFTWDTLEMSPGVYNWFLFDSKVQLAATYFKNIQLKLWVGPDSPNWIYASPYNVPKVKTNDSSTFNHYPYYLNATYKMLWYRLIDTVLKHIETLPTSIRQKIKIYQSAEGTTGDLSYYKGNVLSAYNSYTITDAQWATFVWNEWRYTDSILALKTLKIHHAVNPGDWENFANVLPYINNFNALATSYPLMWRKIPGSGHYYQQNNEAFSKIAYDNLVNATNANCATQIRIRDEFSPGTPMYFYSAVWNSYWTALSSLHYGVDIWNIFSVSLTDPACNAAVDIFGKYGGRKDPACSPGAFCVLRDGLDAANLVRFPSTTYGTGTYTGSTNTSTTGINRCINIANSYSVYGAQQADPNHAQGYGMNQRDATAINDVGWNIFPSNYERYITQWSPNTTSQGYWSQGDITQPYGRFARGFNHSANKDTLFFNIHDDLFTTFPNNAITTVNINVTYLDKGTSKWKLMYDGKNGTNGLSQLMTAYTNSNSNTTNSVIPASGSHQNENYVWKTKSIVITNGMFGNNLAHGTDLMLVNADNIDDIFHMVEIIKGVSLPTGINQTYLQENTEEYVIYPNPTNGDLNINSTKITSGKLYEVNITNLLGQIVYTNNLIGENSLLNLNCSHLFNGVYLVELKSEEGSIVKKIIKE